MKKIVFILASAQGGGAERITINIVNNLPHNKYKTSLIFLTTEGSYRKFVRPGIDIYDLNVKLEELNPLNNMIKIAKISSLFRRLTPDIIFSNGTYCNLLSILARFFSGNKAKLHIRETNLIVSMQKKKPLGIIKLLGFFFLYPHTDTFIAPSQAVVDDFKQAVNFNKTKTVVLPNFIDTSFIDQMAHNDTGVSLAQYPQDNLIIISVARLVIQKDYKSSLLAFKEVTRDVPCDYWILGEGPMEKRLKNLAKELGIENRVKFWGFQENPYIFMSKAKIFFSSSQFEGFPNSLLEAMYLGLPPVVTHFNASITEVITDGQEGFIVEKGDVEKMAFALKRLLTDVPLYESMKKNTLSKIKNYSLNNAMSRLEQIL